MKVHVYNSHSTSLWNGIALRPQLNVKQTEKPFIIVRGGRARFRLTYINIHMKRKYVHTHGATKEQVSKPPAAAGPGRPDVAEAAQRRHWKWMQWKSTAALPL